MVGHLLGRPSLCLLISLVALAQAVEIINPGEVVYDDSLVYGVLGKAVILDCGATLPDVYIWGFTKPGTDTIRAVVYDFGKGPRMQSLAKTLGDLALISKSASLSIDKLPLAAQGLYTCQALYDTDQGAKFYYYYIHLTVRVPVSKPYVLVSDGSPVEGSSMWLQCRLDNGTGPIHYVWEHETRGSLVTTVAQGNSSLVNVTDINRNQTGWYRCVASNAVNRERSDRIWLDIIYGPDDPRIDVTPYSVTERGYSALERETVSLMCQALSNPPSQYVWLYNNSQVYAGPQFTITKILRMHTGNYACLAHNTYLNTRSKKTIRLTVYYPPDGSPSCAVEPAQNHTSLSLLCSWSGGLPSASLHWTRGLLGLGQDVAGPGQEIDKLSNNATLLQSVAQTSNNTLFTCLGSHPALNHTTYCSMRTYSPPAEPVCFAYATRNNQYLMLSCSWNGGAPRALLWWEGPDGRGQEGEENSNILVLRYGMAHSGQAYTCRAKHPLVAHTKACQLTLEAPVLVTQRSIVSVYEGSDVELTCILRANYPPASQITWFNNRRKEVWDTPKKYLLQRAAAWANLTVREADGTHDSGQYWCAASNAVGGTEIPVTLLVMKHPMPPNVTLVKVVYSSRQRSEVELAWRMEGGQGETGGEADRALTGFILEHRWVTERPARRGRNVSRETKESSAVWQPTTVKDPGVRSHTQGSLLPTFTYQFRITPVNHRTIGHPSAAKTPADPPFNAYPAVIGAAIGGMIFAALITALLLMYIIRNRNNNPRLHDMLFGMQHSQSRENINFPEDEVVSGAEGGIEEIGASPSPGPAMVLPRAASPLGATSTTGQAALPGDDNEPVNVTITVKATGS